MYRRISSNTRRSFPHLFRLFASVPPPSPFFFPCFLSLCLCLLSSAFTPLLKCTVYTSIYIKLVSSQLPSSSGASPPKKRKKQNKTKAVTIPRETIQGYIRLYTARVTKSWVYQQLNDIHWTHDIESSIIWVMMAVYKEAVERKVCVWLF